MPNPNEIVPLTAVFLRRLAATVAGWPEQGTYFMLVSFDGNDPKLVLGGSKEPLMLNTEAEAHNRAKTLRSEHGVVAVQVLGPFISPGTLAGYGVKVSKVTLSSPKEPGGPLSWTVPPGVDLLCWTPSAFDKFVAPYYYMLEGSSPEASQSVERLRLSMLGSESGILMHRWPTSTGVLDQEKYFEFLDRPS